MKRSLNISKIFLLSIQKPLTDTVSYQIDETKCVQILGRLIFVFFLTSIFTLLFFREVYINHKLSDKLLKIETENTMKTIQTPLIAITPQKAVVEAPPVRTTVAATAKVTEFDVSCDTEACTLNVNLAPSSSSITEGSLLLVLETEAPRIGLSTSQSPKRNRYLIYPNNKTEETFSIKNLAQYETKNFKFLRILNTSHVFQTGKLSRVIAANLFLFDSEKNLITHERKLIEQEEVSKETNEETYAE